jgi:hypothetical protein
MWSMAIGSRCLEATSWSGETQMEKATAAPADLCRKLDSEQHAPPSAFRWTVIFDTIGSENEWPLECPPLIAGLHR